jgi:pre-rRNA-processing protein TSR3
MLPTVILRHRKENLNKCSLKGLEERDDFLFFTYPKEDININLSSYIMLTIDAPILTERDKDNGLLLIDGTWRYAATMVKKYDMVEKRSLPICYKTAYPRYQTACPDPIRGLASIEALYIAFLITQRPSKNLLDNYYWKEQFLKLNNIKED